MMQRTDNHKRRGIMTQIKGKHRDLYTQGREGQLNTGGKHEDWCRHSQGQETGQRQEVKMENTQGAETTK